MWFRRRRALRDLEQDIRAHIDQEVDDLVGRGVSPGEARRQARVRFGNAALAAEDTRASWGWVWVGQMAQDARHTLRTFRRSPAFVATAVLTLGLGIGGTTAVSSVVDALFFRSPAGVRDPGTIRRVIIARDAGSMQGTYGIWADAAAISRSETGAFEGVAAYLAPQLVDFGRGPSATRVRAALVSTDFFKVLGVQPAAGRLFGDTDKATGASSVVVVSHAFWMSRLGGIREVLGSIVVVNNRPLQVVGITPRTFIGIDGGTVDVWLPPAVAVEVGLQSSSEWQTSVMSALTRHVARLSPLHGDEGAAVEASAALANEAVTQPDLDSTPTATLRPFVLSTLPASFWALDLSRWLLAAACLLLVISCANVANLLLARGLVRRREVAMRLSLGAGPWRILRQQLTESGMIALLAGVTGVLLAQSGVALLRRFELPADAGQVDARMLVVSVVLALLAAVVVGVLPAVRAVRMDPVRTLNAGSTPGALGPNRSRLVLVAMQVAVSFVLLVGALLFVRSLDQIAAIDGGVDLDRLLTVEVNLSGDDRLPSYPEFLEQAGLRLSTVDGVQRSAVVYVPPLEGWGWSALWGPTLADANQSAQLHIVGVGYFETAGTRLLQGRSFLPSDLPGSESVAVVNEALASRLPTDRGPVGECLAFWAAGFPRASCVRVVGVVESQRNSYLGPDSEPMIFRPNAQVPAGIPYHAPMLLVRTERDARAHADEVRAALHGLVPDLPYVAVAPLAERLSELRPFQLGATLFSVFGVLALLIAAVGLHAVQGCFVAERTAEVGIRRALGAPSSSVVRLIVGQSLIPVGVGLCIGFGAAFACSHLLAAQLFGIGPRDPVALAGAAAGLIIVAVLATVRPMWRATRIDPVLALRQQ